MWAIVGVALFVAFVALVSIGVEYVIALFVAVPQREPELAEIEQTCNPSGVGRRQH